MKQFWETLQFRVLLQRQQKAGQVCVNSCKNSDLQPASWRTHRRLSSLYISIELMENPWVESATWQRVTQASSRLWGVDLSQFEEEPNQWRALSGLDTHRFMLLKCGESGIFLQRFCLNAHGFLMALSFSLLFISRRSNFNIVLQNLPSIYEHACSLWWSLMFAGELKVEMIHLPVEIILHTSNDSALYDMEGCWWYLCIY